jgi:hypothetical protein
LDPGDDGAGGVEQSGDEQSGGGNAEGGVFSHESGDPPLDYEQRQGKGADQETGMARIEITNRRSPRPPVSASPEMTAVIPWMAALKIIKSTITISTPTNHH